MLYNLLKDQLSNGLIKWEEVVGPLWILYLLIGIIGLGIIINLVTKLKRISYDKSKMWIARSSIRNNVFLTLPFWIAVVVSYGAISAALFLGSCRSANLQSGPVSTAINGVDWVIAFIIGNVSFIGSLAMVASVYNNEHRCPECGHIEWCLPYEYMTQNDCERCGCEWQFVPLKILKHGDRFIR